MSSKTVTRKSRAKKKTYTCQACGLGGFKAPGSIAAHRQQGSCPGARRSALPQTPRPAAPKTAEPSCKFCPNCGIDLRKVKVAA